MTDRPDDDGVLFWAMPVGGLREADTVRWTGVLDESERVRAARFAFERNRVEYVAAHALTRALLSRVTGYAPTAFRYETGIKGKPAALVAGAPAGVHFNLTHTEGMVAVAASKSVVLGADVEPIDRRVELAVADRYFFGAESHWLHALDEARRAEGFLRLWTLKEAYIKATGLGLAQPLDEFWFEVEPPRIHFTGAIADEAAAWHFRQHVLGGRFLAAVGWRRTETMDSDLQIEMLEPTDLTFDC